MNKLWIASKHSFNNHVGKLYSWTHPYIFFSPFQATKNSGMVPVYVYTVYTVPSVYQLINPIFAKSTSKHFKVITPHLRVIYWDMWGQPVYPQPIVRFEENNSHLKLSSPPMSKVQRQAQLLVQKSQVQDFASFSKRLPSVWHFSSGFLFMHACLKSC